MGSCDCPKDKNGYWQLRCCERKCSVCKNLQNDLIEIPNLDDITKLTFYQFETTETAYISKKTGEEKNSKKYERVHYTEKAKTILEQLLKEKNKYLVHRFQVENDKHEWKQILETVKDIGPVFHMDFSENITASPKFEPQSSHFSKRQFSFHCTVMHTAKEGIPVNTYIYHLSDYVKHDSIFTMNVVFDILNNFDLDTLQPLRFKSDNCSSQYKSKYVLHEWKKLAESVQKTVIVYYGVKGHGKGLVDAMSGFGVKTPLKRAIITEDFFFNKSVHLNRYLQEINVSENRKYYHLNPMSRDTQRQELKIKDCQKQLMMAFFYDGSIQIKENLCSCNACLLGNFVILFNVK